ncbi:universal stress protein [Saccharomonospora glauca]|uniref:Universal stress protein UspA-like protein n=1 Tax=Saccharomonospora glauca K62 TaxID=928724 RepID=I1D5C9_9PSEU|nr:universal stress protein [Saccharomonospora glauca]EIF00154.1 universal stress protein UspA-like protein [Saccharomonospora glauca K62]
MRLRRVLAATDLSAGARLALGRAARLASAHDAQLTVLSVVPPSLEDEVSAFAAETLADHVAAHAMPEVDVVLRTGTVSDTILIEALDREVDLIVLGAHGERGFTGSLTGATTENVAHASHCPVLVVRTPVPDYRTVLLAVDDTTSARRAAQWGIDLTPSAVHVLAHVSVVIGEQLLRLSGLGDSDLERLREASTAEIRPRVEALAAELHPRPDAVVVGSGTPQRALPELVSHYRADLAVTGSGSSTRFERVLLGSVAQSVLRYAPSDVLVVRGSARRTEPRAL